MATMQIQTRKSGAAPLLLLALALALAVLFLSLSAPSRHAVTRHDTNAWSATQRFKQVDPDDDDVWQKVCPDGRRYTFRALRGGAYDVSVDDPITGENITRFTCKSANWIARRLAWCE